MKVLYISHHKEHSGWGEAARNYILALDHAGVDVVPRAIALGQANATLPDRLQQLEKKSTTGCTVCIQHILPHYMKYDNHFSKNIGLFVTESDTYKYVPWIQNLNLMDELWVPCSYIQQRVHQNGIKRPTYVVPHAFDITKYSKTYDRLNLPIGNQFSFYCICEHGVRKHLAALIRAFHTEFSTEEPVELVLKVNKYGCTPEALAEEMKNFCNNIKTNLKLYADASRYKPEIVITANISDQDIMQLHRSLDCFVMPSYGEGFCIPLIEAMGMGNIVISSATGAMLDYIDSERNGFLVNGSIEPVFCHENTFPGFGTARERWFNISVTSLMKTMRRVYQLPASEKDRIRTEAKLTMHKYSYETIGNKMKELLNV